MSRPKFEDRYESAVIHGLCVVKNESDIIEQALRAAAVWCDAIYVLDNGSTDGTWEKVQDLARDLPKVIPFLKDSRPFDDGIRNVIFRQYRSRAKADDWWCILDADEFYIDDPREFLAQVPKSFDRVWQQAYNYLFTDADLAAYESNPALFGDQVPIEERSHHFVLADHSELRFFRHSRVLAQIPFDSSDSSGRVYPRRIRLKHYMYRSPDQIRRRLETRREPMQRGEFLHEKRAAWASGERNVHGPALAGELPQSWKERVVPVSECHEDRGDGILPDAGHWTPPPPPVWTARVKRRARSFVRRVLYFGGQS